MPANIAHILIAHAASDALPRPIQELITSKSAFFYLGSLGPDLPSYRTRELITSALNDSLLRPFVDQSDPTDQDASFFLHSVHPHLIPYHLVETIPAFLPAELSAPSDRDLLDAALVFALGYITHIAADQIIHQDVRRIVGPYYRTRRISQAHAECEVYQDLFLFAELFPTRVYDKTIQRNLIDITKFDFDTDTFCSLVSLAMAKAGHSSVQWKDVEAWVEGVLFTFDVMDSIGPYASAFRMLSRSEEDAERSDRMRRYYRDPATNWEYLSRYRLAVNTAVRYLKTLLELYESRDFSWERFSAYQTAVPPYDLTSPVFPPSMAGTDPV